MIGPIRNRTVAMFSLRALLLLTMAAGAVDIPMREPPHFARGFILHCVPVVARLGISVSGADRR
jgi:hypothetical protein